MQAVSSGAVPAGDAVSPERHERLRRALHLPPAGANPETATPVQNEKLSAETQAHPSSVVPPNGVSVKGFAKSSSIPPKIVEKVRPWLMTVFRVFFSRPPVVAGQDPAAYFALLESAVDEHKPACLDELSLLKRVVDEDWRLLLLQEMQTAVFNATIAAEVLDDLTETAAADHTDQPGPANGEAWQLRMKTLVFAALAGDTEAIDLVEQKLGRTLGIWAQITTRLSESMPVLNYLDRAIKESQTRRDAARRQLAQSRAERTQRIQSRQPTASDIRASLSLASYIELRDEILRVQAMNPLLPKADPTPDPISVRVPRDDAAQSSGQQQQADDVSRED